MRRNVQHRVVCQATILLALPWPGGAATIKMAEQVAAEHTDELAMSVRKGQETIAKLGGGETLLRPGHRGQRLDSHRGRLPQRGSPRQCITARWTMARMRIGAFVSIPPCSGGAAVHHQQPPALVIGPLASSCDWKPARSALPAHGPTRARSNPPQSGCQVPERPQAVTGAWLAFSLLTAEAEYGTFRGSATKCRAPAAVS